MDSWHLDVTTPHRRLDRFLAEAMEGHSRAFLARLIREGSVTVNGKAAKPGTPLKPGDHVQVMLPPPRPSELAREPMDLVLLYRDRDLLVLNKPPGICVHPGAGRTTGTIVNALLALEPNLSSIGGEERPGIVHRLDRDTSGCLVVALNDRAHRALAADFKERRVEKRYIAAISGVPSFDVTEVNGPIRRHPVHRKKMAVLEGGREARTRFRVLGRGEGVAMILAVPFTGRTHQIRVHLAHLGYPVAGDDLYGGRASSRLMERQALHAWSIGFIHPIDGRRLGIQAPLPDDMVHFFHSRGLEPPLYPEGGCHEE